MKNKPQPTRRLLKVKSAAEYLGCSAWKLRRLIQDGELPYIQDSEYGPFLIDIFDLDAYIEKSKKTA